MTGDDHELMVERMERLVVQALDRHRQMMTVDTAALIVDITTRASPGRDEQQRVKHQLARYMYSVQWLLDFTLRFLVDRGLGADDVIVHVQPKTAEDESAVEDDSTLVRRQLVLSYGDVELCRDVAIGQRPVLLLRPSEDDLRLTQERPLPIRLDRLAAVPRGRLLELVQASDGEGGDEPWIALRRTTERAEVCISLDDLVLTPDRQPRRLRRSGVLSFAEDGLRGVAEVAYQLRPQGESRSAGEELDYDRTPMELTRLRSTGRVTIRVDAPSPLQPIEPRRFPIGGGDLVSGTTEVTVGTLHTTASTVGSPGDQQKRWFVKLFACGSPQTAHALRAYFDEQATMIGRANQSAQSGGADTFAVAPIEVVPATPAEPAGRTDLTPPMRTPAAPTRELADRLPAWFGMKGQRDPDSYVVVLAPFLQRAGWPETVDQPAYLNLVELRPVAAGLAKLHDARVLHSDLKPANLCRQGDSYVLVDADAVVAEGAITPANWRVDWTYTSRLVREYLTGGARIDVYEHDRFGFVLLALTVVAGHGLIDYLLEDIAGTRRVDSHAEVIEALAERFPEWPKLVEALGEPFRNHALQGGPWHGQEWLDEIIKAGEEDRQPSPPPPPSNDGVAVPPPEKSYPFAIWIREFTREGGLLPPSEQTIRMRDCLEAELLRRAREAERKARIRCWVIPIAATAILILFLILGL